MSKLLVDQERLKEVYDARYIKLKLLNNFFKMILFVLVLFKIITSTVFIDQNIAFPFIPVTIFVGLQYLIFNKYKKVYFSTNLLLLSLFVPMVFETLNTGGIYSDNLLYFLLITPVCLLLLDIKQTAIWTFLTIAFVIFLYILERNNPGHYFQAANFEPFYYFTAIFWLFALISGFMITSGIIISKIFKQLEKQKEQLVQQHSSLLSVNDKLIDTEKSLRKSNKALEQFAHATAHDLKQPLRTMASFAQLANRRVKQLGINDEALGEYLQFIQSGSGEMSLLVEQLMAYATIKANQDLEQKDININNLVERILLQLNLKGEYPKTQTNIDLENLVLNGQPAKTRQLFQNLIVNALKFSGKQEQPLVTISSQEKEKDFWFCIEDNGIGIDPENHEKVFQLFTKMNNGKEFKGSGIGLSTCKEIVSQMGGDIWLESNLNQGCKIFFSIPKCKISKSTKNQHPLAVVQAT